VVEARCLGDEWLVCGCWCYRAGFVDVCGDLPAEAEGAGTEDCEGVEARKGKPNSITSGSTGPDVPFSMMIYSGYLLS